MKMLKSFGCSFIYGCDLADCDSTKSFCPSIKTWPALLAQRMGYHYGCYAKGGKGNLYILNQVINQIMAPHRDLFVIGWTWVDRADYVTNDNTWQVLRPSLESDLAEFYYKHLFSDQTAILQNLIYIKTAIDLLTQNHVPFVMTHMDWDLFQTCADFPNQLRGVSYLLDLIRPYMTTFDGMNFLDWSRKNNYAESPLWHPLEQAHESACDYIFKKTFDKQNTNDPARRVLF